MRLNNKGYMLVEVIVASSIALVMAYFLIDITIRLVNKNNDYYLESVLLADKNLITKEIMDDINNMKLTSVVKTSTITTLNFNDNDNIVTKELIVDKENKKVIYGNYSKTFNDNINLSNPIIQINADNILTIKISAYTNYSNEDYGIKIVVPYDPTVVDVSLPPEDNSFDNSGANFPELIDGMIPVMYYNNNWVKADIEDSTSAYSWYDYNAKKWANAILVSSNNRTTYKNASAGTKIIDSDILAFYVWIPRYKYKVWNINKIVGTTNYNYNAYNKGINIEFENGKKTTGTIVCDDYDFKVTEGNGLSEICYDVTNGNGYYTHPAFTFGEDEITGFWIGKFEISNSISQVKIIPNVQSLRNQTFDSFWSAIYNMQNANNSYGLSTNRTVVDSHMLTNMEWGAVAYLTHSDYGRCSQNTCTEIAINNSSSFYTGKSAGAPGSDSTATNSNGSFSYQTSNGQLASTTGNIYGVYDMSGAAYEYVMGNMGSNSTAGVKYTYNASNAGTNYTYEGYEKYITTYSYGTSSTNQNGYNRGRLGDATSEIVLAGNTTGGWFGDNAIFFNNLWSCSLRGGNYANGTSAGLFNFNRKSGEKTDAYSTRAALIGF